MRSIRDSDVDNVYNLLGYRSVCKAGRRLHAGWEETSSSVKVIYPRFTSFSTKREHGWLLDKDNGIYI